MDTTGFIIGFILVQQTAILAFVVKLHGEVTKLKTLVCANGKEK